MKKITKTLLLVISLIGAFIYLFYIYSKQASYRYEKTYQKTFCEKMGGKMEVRLQDGVRVDCLTSAYAIEIDFAKKWAESVGQALYYGYLSGRQPAVAIIVNDNEKDRRNFARLEVMAGLYGIHIFQIARR